MNGRTVQQVDYRPDVHMNLYIDIPELNARAPHLPESQNHDVHVNNFGCRLLNFWIFTILAAILAAVLDFHLFKMH